MTPDIMTDGELKGIWEEETAKSQRYLENFRERKMKTKIN
jgi:hypothetical protein